MTRFKVLNEKYDNTSLSNEDIKYLFNYLFCKSETILTNVVKSEIKFMENNSLEYRVINSNEEIVVVIRKSISKIKYSIGYPFPVATIEKDAEGCFTGYSVQLYLRGKTLRDKQYAHFYHVLAQCSDVKMNFYKNKKDFKKIFKIISHSYLGRSMAFYDMYRFIGDSILNTYIYDEFKKYFKSEKAIIFSRQNDHLSALYNVEDIDNIERIYDYDVVILSDYIDISDGETQKIIIESIGNHLYILLSRNMFIVKNDNTYEIYKVCDEYVLFNNQNIYNYMNEILNDFIESRIEETIPLPYKRYKECNKIYFNPYASLLEKSLKVEEVINICRPIIKIGYEIIIPFGHDFETKETTNIIKKQINCSTLYTKDISELTNYFLENNVHVISVDSSISHLAVKCRKISITLYKNGFWDKYSIQSICNESPIGFCSYAANHLPIVLGDKLEQNISEIETILSSINHETYNTDNIKYSDISLISDKSLKVILNGKSIDVEKLSIKNKIHALRKG